MEENYISISTLNDFIFCPYSIYRHNVYENTDESLFHAVPQTQVIDRTVRTAFHRKQFTAKDFTIEKGEYRLKRELSQEYYKVFVEALIKHKMDIFFFVQAYYRAFMRNAPTCSYPQFSISS